MKRNLAFILSLFCLFSCGNENRVMQKEIREAIAEQVKEYPQTRVQDIYKSFCQEALGPGHLIPDPEAARNYLQRELAEYRTDLAEGRYEKPATQIHPTGSQGNYVRMDLSLVLDGVLSEDQLLDAFVRSANAGQKLSEAEWVKRWAVVESVIRRDFPDLPDAASDLANINGLIAQGELIMHHSEAYEQSYHPHYRIVAHDIFEDELQPLLHSSNPEQTN